MIRYVKTFTIFALISVGISFVLFLFFGSSNPKINSFEISYPGGGNTVSPSGPLQPSGTFDKLVSGVSRVLGISESNEATGQDANQNTNETNLTEIFGKLMADKIIEGNPEGAQQIDGQESLVMPGSLNLADPNLKQKMFLFKNQILSPSVDINKFHIIETTKKEDLTKYILLLHSSYKKIVNDFAVNLDVSSFDEALKNYEVIGRVFEEYVKVLYSIEVPVAFKELHKEVAVASEAQKNIAIVVLDLKNDPLKAAMAGNLQKELNAQFIKLGKEEIALVAKYKLPINLKLIISN